MSFILRDIILRETSSFAENVLRPETRRLRKKFQLRGCPMAERVL